MRFRLMIASMLAVVAGCAGNSQPPVASPPSTAPPESEVAVTPPVNEDPDPQPAWEGFASNNGEPVGLTAITLAPVDVYETPGSSAALTTLQPTTILGTTTVLGVVSGPDQGWVEVMLPIRPNGSTGWIRAEGLFFYVVDSEIIVDLSDRKLTYLVDGVETLQTDIGVGSDHNQTPIGRFFVTDNVTLSDPNSPWGPYALGLSARSETITEFNGGDGIIGIHGTNNPGSIGESISLGCIRLPNEVITILHELVPIGTRVTINA